MIGHVGGMPIEELLLPLCSAAGAGALVAGSWIRSHLRRARPAGHRSPAPSASSVSDASMS